MAAEGTFSGVFADVTSEMLASSENHATVAEASALEHGHVAT